MLRCSNASLGGLGKFPPQIVLGRLDIHVAFLVLLSQKGESEGRGWGRRGLR